MSVLNVRLCCPHDNEFTVNAAETLLSNHPTDTSTVVLTALCTHCNTPCVHTIPTHLADQLADSGATNCTGLHNQAAADQRETWHDLATQLPRLRETLDAPNAVQQLTDPDR